jgi:carboxypeptidase Q
VASFGREPGPKVHHIAIDAYPPITHVPRSTFVKRALWLLVILTLGNPVPAPAQEPVDQEVVARIKTEAFQNSKVLATVSSIADVFGPRLTASPELKAAGEWCRDEMTRWGLANAQLEPWGTLPRTWSVRRYSAEMMTPAYMRLNAVPKAWTPGTNGVISGTPVLVEVRSKADFDKFRGKLKGAIVMNGKPAATGPRFEPDARRYTDAELSGNVSAINPGEPKSYIEEDKDWDKNVVEQDEITKFFSDEGIAALLEPNRRGLGLVRAMAQSYTLDNPSLTFPALVVAAEHYGRIVRLLDRKVAVRLELNVDASIDAGPTNGYNVVAELPGTDPKLKDEVVLLGGHLDSWHAATGATDNAAGCAIVMEALRVLKAIGVRPRRTIRVALWGGEEQDYYGSLGYAKRHYGDPATGKPGPEHEKLAAYFNVDNGHGKIRGVYLQGNELVRPIFESYLRPLNYLGATALTVQNTGSTDHMAFEALGLPAFQFIQDPLDYESRTHHSSLDVYEELVEDDLKQAAAVVATFAYHTANRAERLPRKVPPKP